MTKKIREIHNQKVPRNLVYAMMEHVDPSGLEERGGIGQPKQDPKGVFTSKVNHQALFHSRSTLHQSNANGDKEYENSKHTLDIFCKQNPKTSSLFSACFTYLSKSHLSSSSSFYVSFFIRAAILFYKAKGLVTTPSQCIMTHGCFFCFCFCFCLMLWHS